MAEEEVAAEYHKEKKREEMVVTPMEATEDWCMFECIEKVASVVAWTPSAELFFMQIMQGDEEFGFMIPGNAYHSYYLERIDVLRLRPRPLYNERFSVSVSVSVSVT